MKILVISPKNKTVFNFRGDLIKDMIANGHEVLVVGPNREYEEDVLALGVKELIVTSLVKDNTSVKGDLRYLSELKKIMKQHRPDLVFSYTIKPVVYGSIAAKACKVPHISAMVTGLGRVYASGGIKTKMIRAITKMLYKKAFSGCENVIFQNDDDIKELVAQHYLPAEKAKKVDGSGVNMQRFCQSPLPSQPVFLMVSRIIREKGVMEYCLAAREVKKDFPQARFILLGGFDQSIGALKKEDIQPFIDDGSIEFPGEVKDPVSFYHQASVFVLPSYYREGLPRTILEAMSCARAIITTDWPGCREAVIDGENGYLIEIKNAEMLADRMKRFAADPALLQRMAQASNDRCKKTYEVGIVNKKMKEYIGY